MPSTNQYLVRSIVFLLFIGMFGFSSVSASLDQKAFVVNDTSKATSIKNISTGSFVGSVRARYPIKAAFKSNTLRIFDGNESGNYVLQRDSKSDLSFNGTKLNLSSHSIDEGRYIVNDTTSASNHTEVRIDILNPTSDVLIRSNGLSGDLEFKEWLNYSKDISVPSSNVSETSLGVDTLYKVNISAANYWLGLNGSEQSVFLPSRSNYGVSKPRVNDLWFNSSNSVSGRVIDANNPSRNYSGIKLRLSSRLNTMDRIPYVGAPPVRYDTTNASGMYSFENLPAGEYTIETVSTNVTRADYNMYDTVALAFGKSDKRNISVLTNVGNITGTINGPKSEEIHYGVVLNPDNSFTSIMEPFSDPGNFSVNSLAVGNYSYIAAKFNHSGRVSYTTTAGTLELNSSNEPHINLDFPPGIKFNGTVEDSKGDPISGAELIVSNQTKGKYVSIETDSTGEFELTLANNTGYKVRIEPALESKYVSKNVDIKPDSYSNSKTFELSEGANFTGKVMDGGQPVEARVYLDNYSKGIYKDAKTGGDGEFSFKGLKQGNYSISIYPQDFKKTDVHTSVWINASGNERNFSVERGTSKLEGHIENKQGQGLNATVRINGYDTGIDKSVVTGSDGKYSFSDLPSRDSYSIEVDPAKPKYGEKEDYTFIDSDEVLNFTLLETEGLNGYIEDSDGQPVKGVSIYASNSTVSSYGWDTTDSDGSYSMELSQVNHSIHIYPGGNLQSKSTEVNVSNYSNSLKNFTLKTGTYLDGQIKGQASSAEGYISLWNFSENSYGYAEIENGEYNVTGLKNVNHTVWVSLRNSSFDSKRKTLDKPKDLSNTKNFTFSKNKGRKLAVTVTGNSTGKLDAKVAVGGAEKTTGDDGKAVFGYQPKNTEKRILVNKEGYRGKIKTVETKSRKTGFGTEEFQNVTVTLNKINRLKLEANVSKSGKSVSGATLMFTSNETGISVSGSGTTGGNGKTSIEGLAEGSYQLTLVVGENSLGETSTKIRQNKTASLNVSGSSLDSEYSVWYEVKDQ